MWCNFGKQRVDLRTRALKLALDVAGAHAHAVDKWPYQGDARAAVRQWSHIQISSDVDHLCQLVAGIVQITIPDLFKQAIAVTLGDRAHVTTEFGHCGGVARLDAVRHLPHCQGVGVSAQPKAFVIDCGQQIAFCDVVGGLQLVIHVVLPAFNDCGCPDCWTSCASVPGAPSSPRQSARGSCSWW